MLNSTGQFHVIPGMGFVAECSKTTYVLSGTKLCNRGKKARSLSGKVVDVPTKQKFIRLKIGYLQIMSWDISLEQEDFSSPGSGAHRITCSSGYLFDSFKPG